MNASNSETGKQRSGWQRFLRWLPVILLLIVLAIAGMKGWRIYQKGMLVYRDVTVLRGLMQNPAALGDLETVTSTMTDLQGNLDAFSEEAGPALWLSSRLGWVPTYGGDLTNAPDLLDLADRLVDVSVTALQAAEPLLNEMNSPDSSLDPAGLTSLLVDAQPELLKIREEFDLALGARNQVQVEQLSPRLQGLLVDELDPLLGLMDDGLSLSTALPVVLGADGSGPKTYLLLAQNEDELRATGGFITTVGKLILQNGRIISLDFEGVDNEEDWTKPFPAAPWQLQEYMNAEVLILRDSNWFADFPTSARWAEYLYTYNHPGHRTASLPSINSSSCILLQALGPAGSGRARLTRSRATMSSSTCVPPRNPRQTRPLPADWYRKNFIGDMADAFLKNLLGGGNNDWRGLAAVLVQAIEERHLYCNLMTQRSRPCLRKMAGIRRFARAMATS